MKAEKARIPITDFIKVWCELCRIRIDADEERIGVGGKTYHPDCYAELFSIYETDGLVADDRRSPVRTIS
jgi:hypothetical protein